MSEDLKDFYSALKEHNKEEKESNLEKGRQALKDAGIEFRELNFGYHLKIGKIDFCPSRGAWRDGVKKKGRGGCRK